MQAGHLNAYKAAPDPTRAVQRVEAYIQQCGLEKSLIELVKGSFRRKRPFIGRLGLLAGCRRVGYDLTSAAVASWLS